jgi:hypothetical protein
MLSAIVAVTLLVPGVQAVERAYRQVLDYQTVERGQLTADQAASWGRRRWPGANSSCSNPAVANQSTCGWSRRTRHRPRP